VKTSLFEIFKVGIGPSSSHTVGPMRAAADFVGELNREGLLQCVTRLQAELYGSLALTGKGHGTDRAILLGLSGEVPDKVDPESIEPKLLAIRQSQSLELGGIRTIAFNELTDVAFHNDQVLPGHSNGMRFRALADETEIAKRVYYSIGGGFFLREGETPGSRPLKPVPYPFSSADQLLHIGHEHGRAIWQIALENEKAWRSEEEIHAYVRHIWEVMQRCVQRGSQNRGDPAGRTRSAQAGAAARQEARR
jgi:L-serine dehydratase